MSKALKNKTKLNNVVDVVADFGADPTGVTTSTVAIQAAVNSGKSVFIPDGTYLIDTVYFPNSASDAIPNGYSFTGSPNVVFLQNTANTALFRKTATSGRLYNWQLGPFCVMPKAGTSSTVSAIFTTGMTGCTWNRIEGLSNGSAGFYAIMDFAASPYLSYHNTVNNLTLVGTLGYTKAAHFENNGTGAAGNCNLNNFNAPFIYNNTGLSYGIDCNLSYGVTINSPAIEANSTATAIYMGAATTVIGGSLEANAADFNYVGTNTVNNTTVIGTTLATAHTISFGSSAYNNLWLNVGEFNPQTWTNLGTNCQKISSNMATISDITSGTRVLEGGGIATTPVTGVVSANFSQDAGTTKTAGYLFLGSDTVGTVKQTAIIAAVPTAGANWTSAKLSFQLRTGDVNPVEYGWISGTAMSLSVPFFPEQQTTVAAPGYVKGGMYFDTTLNKLRIGGATAWETVTSV